MKTLSQFVSLTIILLFASCSQNVIHPREDMGGNKYTSGIQSMDTSRHTLKQAISLKRLKFAVKRKSS